MNTGYVLYRRKCGNCHYLYRPAEFTEMKWKSVMPVMSLKAKLSPEEKNLILNYILSAKKSRE